MEAPSRPWWPQGELTQRILTEELAAAGVAAHVTAPDFSAIGDGNVWTPPAVNAVAEADVEGEPEGRPVFGLVVSAFCVARPGRRLLGCAMCCFKKS